MPFSLPHLATSFLVLATSILAFPADATSDASLDLIPSPDGTCGPNTTYTCLHSTTGPCCSSYNFCGNTTSHCLPSHGCQASFGYCTAPGPAIITPSLDGVCGYPVTCAGGPF